MKNNWTFLVLIILMSLSAQSAEKKVITPAGARPPVGPYSPGIIAGNFLYVSGQGAAKADGTFPDTAAQQLEQCLSNVRAIVEGAGLTMAHVVYATLYLKNIAAYEDANRVWATVFPNDPPARAVVGVSKMPTDTPVEVTVVAVRDLSQKRVVPGGIMVGDRLYLSGSFGRDKSGGIPQDPAKQVEIAFDRMAETLKAAGMDFRNVVFVNPYLTDKMPQDTMNKVYAQHFEFGNTPARATIKVASLPNEANIEFTGVAVRDLSKRRAVRPKNMPQSATASPCVFAEDTFYCSAKAGFIPGPQSGIYAPTVETQVRQTMRNLLDGLEEAGLTFDNVVATNVYLDDINDFTKMNRTYAQYFAGAPPTRTTVQQYPPVAERKANDQERWPTLEQISVIAVK
jgi:2-iminobutanoate/2-iminopropanoate deaminase